MKLHIKRQRGHWILEQYGQMVDWTRSFREACRIAARWKEGGWTVAKGWKTR